MTSEEITWLGEVFGGTDVLSSADVCDYFDVIRDAFSIHIDREKIRNGLWKDYPAEDQANQIKVKVDRVLRSLAQLEGLPAAIDVSSRSAEFRDNISEELYDIINYAVFAVRIVNGRVDRP